ncbi:MAG: 4-(cytidine 5'-diphospho)-2-C-methyl-D-erythritol kinase [Candidatus Omnitrophica bacterium]|nr:4-(cytidine 5'-diphospho)-2-C-methyl-D-erythritol kinase [Candidatus Omnitrophota bacterium]
MKILAPAKVNLFLEVGSSIKGLHNIVSLVDIVDLYDIIEIEEATRTEVKFLSEWKIPDENTVTKALFLFKETSNIKKNVRVTINKKIPPGSGLGGGSSDAAAVLLSLTSLYNIKTTEEQLIKVASIIGSDVPLFIKGRRCIVEGTGDKISCKGISSVPLVYYLLVPSFAVSTGSVYKEMDILGEKGDLTESICKIKILNEYIMKKDISGIEKGIFNRLEKPYFNLWKEGKEVRKKAEKETGKRFFVSGSGGTLFSVFLDRTEVEKKTRFLEIEGWKGYVVESIKTS